MLFAVSMCLILPLIAGSVEASTNKSLSANRLNSINTEYKIDSTKWSDEKIDQLVKVLSELHRMCHHLNHRLQIHPTYHLNL